MKKHWHFYYHWELTVSMLAGCGSKTNETTAATDAQTESGCRYRKEYSMTMTQQQLRHPDKTYKIGVLQYVQHDALDASNEGFFAALDDLG